jgi:hypothetical protein
VGLGVEKGVVGDWIAEIFIKKLENGVSTRFWFDHWIGLSSLKEAFPRLYGISLQINHTIQEMEEWVNDKWIWHIKWRRIESIVVVPQVWGSWARRRLLFSLGKLFLADCLQEII